jgi:hypothetical protein
MNLVFALRMHNHHNRGLQQPQRDPSLFAIVFAVIFKREGWTSKDLFSMGKIQLTLATA